MTRFRLVIISLALLFATNTSYAQLTWQRDSLNPVVTVWTGAPNDPTSNMVVYSPSVMWDSTEGVYKMWYASLTGYYGSTFCISYAISKDGSHWFPYAKNPVLVPDVGPQAFDGVWMRVPSVVRVGGTYKMYYTGYDGVHQSIGLAQSQDGIHWVKNPANPILHIPGAGEPKVIYADTQYCMIFSYIKDLYRATSKDGLTWSADTSKPILQTDTVVTGPYLTPEGFVRGDSLYYALFGSGPGTAIRLAYSTDGITWKKVTNAVLVPGYASDPYIEFGSLVLKDNIFEYWYSAKATLSAGWQIFHATSPRTPVKNVTSVFDFPAAHAPEKFALTQNYPNPFNPTTTISYALPGQANVSLTVYNELGQRTVELVNEVQGPGNHEVHFDGSSLASGVYFYRLEAGKNIETKKLVLLK